MSYLCVFISFIFMQVSHAGLLSDLEKPDGPIRWDKMQHLKPNELSPKDSMGIVMQAAPGAYVSVGTERSFLGASYNEGTTHLIVVDRNPNVIRFVRINAILLKIAYNREDYLQLRLRDNVERIQARVSQANLSVADRALIADGSKMNWWVGLVRSDSFFDFQTEDPSRSMYNGNYLRSDLYFGRIQRLAAENRISAIEMDLKDGKAFGNLVRYLKKNRITLSVFDLSNSWYPEYISELSTIRERLVQLYRIATKGSVFMFSGHNVQNQWVYVGLSFDRLAQAGGLDNLGTYLAKILKDPFRKMIETDANQLNPGVFAAAEDQKASKGDPIQPGIWSSIRQTFINILRIRSQKPSATGLFCYQIFPEI